MLLSGSDLAEYIKQRHAQRVKALGSRKVHPKLAIVATKDDPVIDTYTRVKERYGEDIGVVVEVNKISQREAAAYIKSLNANDGVHGIVLQLPLEEPSQTGKLINQIDSSKDIDSLGAHSPFDAPTPVAIMWLLSAHNIDLEDKKVVVVGRGRLVGAPLVEMLENSGVKPAVADEHTQDIAKLLNSADVIISAAGQAGLIKTEMVKEGATVVDAGTSSAGGKTVGDADPGLYEREDIKITPARGGVGPLTVAVLFENLLAAAEKAGP